MDENLKKAVRESGNNLHFQVVDILKKTRFENINLSCYYYDDALLIPREIDIIASHKYKDYNNTEFDKRKIFDVNLFIECKHFKEEISFRPYIVNPIERESAVLINPFLLLEASKTDKGHMADTKHHIIYNSQLSNHHHFTKAQVGRLHDTSGKQERDFFNTITQPVKSYIFNEQTLNQGISYLIVVYEGIDGIYNIEEQDYTDQYLDSLDQEKISTLGIKYSYRDALDETKENVDFFIDFVHKDKFQEYLEEIIIPETRMLANFVLLCK